MFADNVINRKNSAYPVECSSFDIFNNIFMALLL